MPRPKEFYRGEKRSTWILTLVLSVMAAALALFGWLFYDLQRYVVYEKDGLRLSVTPEEDAAVELPDTTGRRQVELLDVEIVVDKTDYSAVQTTAGTDLRAIHARYVQAEFMTTPVLDSFVAGMGDYDALVLEVKPASGFLSYASSVPVAFSYGVNGALDLRAYAAKLKENGVYLVAQLSCLVDGAMATRYSPIALKNAVTGEVFTNDGLSWLDPYSDTTRAYLGALLEELQSMGFDEVLLTGMWCPSSDMVQFSSSMTVTPDSESAVSSLALYLRGRADELGIKLSGMAEGAALRGGEAGALGQDLAVFFKAFDRVAFTDDSFTYEASMITLTALVGSAAAENRVLPVCAGYAPDHGSYVVK